MTRPYAWNGATVTNILTRREYLGHTVNFRSSKASFKEKRKPNTPDMRMTFPDTHEASLIPGKQRLSLLLSVLFHLLVQLIHRLDVQ